MGILIDTSVFIEHEKGKLNLNEIIERRSGEQFALSVISASELLHGVHRAADPLVRNRRTAFVEEMLDSFPLIAIDMEIARIHAKLWADLQSIGQSIGSHDTWLAATCLTHGHAIATLNTRHFARVPSLAVEKWPS